MKTITCGECGHQENGENKQEALKNIENHIRSTHPEKASQKMSEMMDGARQTMTETEEEVSNL